MKVRAGAWSNRFLASTRGQIVTLIRHGLHTVAELADALALTDNAVRAHLATLERDGLVRRTGERRGFRRPHYSYGLTAEAEELFPKTYAPLLSSLLTALKRRLGRDELNRVLGDVARAIAASRKVPADLSVARRLNNVAGFLRDIGGHAHVERDDGTIAIRSSACPLSALTQNHPEVCEMIAKVITQLLGVRTEQKCEQRPVPRCCFEAVMRCNATSRRSRAARLSQKSR